MQHMGRGKDGEQNIRKLSRVGDGYTYSVTLPIEAVRDFEWQEGQKVVVEVDKDNKRFVIKDWDPKQK